VRESILVRIGADPPARIWSGVGDLLIIGDALEDGPVVYLGGAELISAPDFQQLINGTAERLDVTVSGVTAETIRLAIDEAPTVKGASLHLGTIQFDESWQSIGGINWQAEFRVDTLTITSQAVEQGRTRSLTLSIGTDDTGRSGASMAFFTDADQRRRSPTDKFCDHVSGITAGTSRRFGPK
jgi:hypothetical protein